MMMMMIDNPWSGIWDLCGRNDEWDRKKMKWKWNGKKTQINFRLNGWPVRSNFNHTNVHFQSTIDHHIYNANDQWCWWCISFFLHLISFDLNLNTFDHQHTHTHTTCWRVRTKLNCSFSFFFAKTNVCVCVYDMTFSHTHTHT